MRGGWGRSWLCAFAALGLMASACSSNAQVQTQEASAAAILEPATTVPPSTLPSTTLPPTTTTPPTSAPATTVPPPRAPVVIGIAGDSTFTDGLDQRDPFGQIIDLTSSPDLMIVNLETAVADPGVGRPPVDKRFLFRSPPASLDLLVDAGVDVVTLANNHTLDFGADALAQTLDEIDARPLLRVGAGPDEAAAYRPLIVDVGDWTVGLISLSRVPCDWSASGENVRPQVAWACPAFLDLAVAATEEAMAAADATIVMIHGGEEGVLCPSPFMVELEASFAALGVDAVINGHPHVLQGVTRHGDTWAAHSLGNFAFPPARGITGNTAIVELTVSEQGVDLALVPVRSDGGVLSPPSGAQRTEILDQVQRHSNGVTINADGTVVADPSFVGVC